MKTFALLGVLISNSSLAAVIQNDAMIVTPTTAPPGINSFYLFYPHQFILTQTAPPGDGLFLLEVEHASSFDFTFRYAGIAEAYGLFLSPSGTILDSDFVNTQTAFVNNWNSPGEGTLTLGFGQTAYVGYWDKRSGPGITATSDDLFGWALLQNQAGALTVIDSATATSGGIVVGTLQQVPETQTALMVLFGGCATLLCRRRLSQNTKKAEQDEPQQPPLAALSATSPVS
jgi:hypothetical protein